ncbi:MAG TPA: gliding motility-associated C-terminal domain-containing protein [Elusimicrobiota bacterium]|nr:gliding motility-associated C-terminal domain-containing protein [Elusimicrobiota bacterium]
MVLITRARSLLLSAALLLCPGGAWAIQSSSLSFTNTRSAVNSGGLRKYSPSFRADGSIGALAQTAANSASYRGRDGLIPGYYYPSASTLFVSSVVPGGTEAIQWVSAGNDGNEHSKPGGYIVRYSSVAAQAPWLSDAAFDAAADASPVPAAAVGGTTVTMIVSGLTPGVVYYFAMKTYERDGTRSGLSTALKNTNVPQDVFGVALTTGASSVSLRWMPTVRYADGVSFAVPAAPSPNELNGYRVYRATAPILAPWTDVADLSTATVNWTDAVGDPQCRFQCYYFIAASNTFGLSNPSVVRSAADHSAYIVASDGASFFEVTGPDVAPVEGVVGDPNSAYLIKAATKLVDLGSVNGRVVKSVGWDAYRGGVLLAPNLPIPGLGILHLSYGVSATNTVTPSAVGSQASNMSVYWYNGASWVQLYGLQDSYSQTMTIRTVYVGQYQLRTVERTGGFAFNQAGVSNRFVTPNGDHKNDNVVFTFDNPQDSAVTAKILDMRGRVVASNLPAGPLNSSVMWDGTSNGHPVPGGVYIYQIQSEGKTFTGTLVVVK